MKKILSFVLSILMVIAIVPVSVFMVSAEGETVDLYYNDFETAMNPAGGTQSSCERADYETYGKAMTVYAGGRWDEPVKLNNATGAITIVMNAYTNNFVNQTTLGINGVQVVHCGGDSVLKIGAVKGTAVKSYRKLVITVEIPDLSTGTANVTVANADGSYPTTGTAELGAISDTLNLYVVAGNNSMKVMDVKVSQVASNGSDVETDTLLNVGAISYSSNSTNSFNEYTVTTNGTDGKITISFVTGNANWQYKYNILSVNGKALITANGTSGNSGYTLGANSDVIYTWNGRTYTVEIQPLQGVATINDGQGNSATVNVGPITESFTMTVGRAYSNGWNLSSINVTQIGGSTHTCEYKTVVTPATCTAPEFTVKTCEGCGTSTTTVTDPVLGHTWGEWTKNDAGASTRTCSVCSATETKTVGEIDTSKTFLAIGDSLTYALKTPNTINDSWAKKVAENLGMTNYLNKAVHGSEAYHWYSLLTGKAALNGTTYTLDSLINEKKLAFDPNFDKEAMIDAIESASVVAFTLGSNDMSKGYLQHRTPKQIHDTIIALIDEIHKINPNAVVIAVGYAYGLATTIPVDGFIGSYDHFVELGSRMTETLNSNSYNSFAYYVDVSKTMSDYDTQGNDKVHPTAAGHIEMANDVIAALASIDAVEGGATTTPDTTTREDANTYVNNFDGTAPTGSVLQWAETGTDGMLTVAPDTDPQANLIRVGSAAFPGNAIMTFKFKVPQLPESGNINIFYDRATSQSYVCIFSTTNAETGTTEFLASVGNNNETNKAVNIKEDEWYTVTILFAPDTESYSTVYINGQFIGTVKGSIVGRGVSWGFANFVGCNASGVKNAATYCIDDFTVSTFADEALVKVSGFQKTKVVDGTYNVRFTAAINGILSLQEDIGFEIAATYTDENGVVQKKTWVLTTKTVYKSISAKYGTEEITADQVGAEYLTTVAITSVDAIYDSVEFEVRPYVTVDEVQYYGTTVTVTVHPEA